MKIIKILFFQGLALALTLAVFNVYAADQSICNPDANVDLHKDGTLKSCLQLKDNYSVNDVQCKSDSPISFYENGNLESCVLASGATIGETDCKADELIYLFSNGNLKSCVKQD